MKYATIAWTFALAFVMTGSVQAKAGWNTNKARDVGESVVSGPTARTFASNAQKAKEVMARLGDALAQNRVLPNGTYRGRVRSGLTTGQLETGNCQWSAEMLREALRKAGVPDKDMFLVFSHVQTASVMGLNPFEVNRTNCALAVMVNGRPVVYDLWKHGMGKGSFSGARSSQWNGIYFAQWAVRIKHYDWYGFEGPTIGSATNKRPDACQTDLIAAWKAINKPKRNAQAVQPPPSPKTSAIVSGSYRVSAGGALLTWYIVVGSGGAIAGTCNGSEALKGSISGNEIKIRRSCPGWYPPYQDNVGRFVKSQIVGKFTGAGVSPGERFDWSMPLRPSP